MKKIFSQDGKTLLHIICRRDDLEIIQKDQFGRVVNKFTGQPADDGSGYDAQGRPKIEWQKPLAIGLGIGAADAATRKDHQLPADLSINIPQTPSPYRYPILPP